jgi:hypothetical protein
LSSPSFDIDAEPCGPSLPYSPQPGDIFLSSNPAKRWQFVFWLARTGQPSHSGIVIALPDGRMGLFEAGPGDTIHVAITEPMADFLEHTEHGGHVWIRRRAVPLTAEQSRRLTDFALAQEGKWFACCRMVNQLSFLRCRNPLWIQWLGKPHGNRTTYFCSELVIESCVAAGLMDAEHARPGATFPRDLFFGRSNNAFLDANLQINDAWLPPARWLPTVHAER